MCAAQTPSPLFLATGALAVAALTGCSQVTHLAGDALSVDVQAACTSIDDAYGQYPTLLEQGGVSAEQADAAWDDLVSSSTS
ncbi:hypothetical protein [Microbacterium sp. Se63.02b]|uniref:hypothetical protein n=1 Tax=Microbacterium sp. Se63.02b TaxID=2709304 RepID=UPI001605417D|nr:hypothetical protein [Microbacterium sp. Se63.02b]